MEVEDLDAATMAFSVPAAAAGALVPGDAFEVVAADGVPHATPLAMRMGTGMIDPADGVIELGSGPAADELRSLGLPKAPDFASWGTNLAATFQLGHPIP